MDYCEGCRNLVYEKLPRGGYSAHCMDGRKAEWLGRNRTLDISALGKPRQIRRPVWCMGKEMK